ncbi:BMC domain protein [Sedimentibacter sp. zth1]|uniref:BMC domain protein n=1 Tax=Sedimentibacter sp. zth1 TaxID=2816908 RepID=UPI001A92C9FB|nr:BMC domain protein [Sedimentibacter sp. zth1]QSX05621.1 BMC domain protein [Sedimentibacter sp. zth1]
MDYRIIKSPSAGTREIIKKRIGNNCRTDIDSVGAIGLVQGKVIDMLYASDVAEKSVGVTVEDIKGNCPQHITLIGIFGDIASVEVALNDIKTKLEEGKSL